MNRQLLLGMAGAMLLSAAPQAQTLKRVRVAAPDAEALATALEERGFDVLEGSAQSNSLEIVGTDFELAQIRAEGYEYEILQVGRPLRERLSEDGESVPSGYADLAGVTNAMLASAASFPAICEFVDLTARYGTPTTFEGRALVAVKISDNVSQEEDEPALLIVSAHHCRELVTPVIALNAIEELTTQYGVDPTITNLVDNNEIWIAPVWNPDGYQYVFDVDDLWRKNRRVFPNGVGVDLNRNYPYGWTNPCAGSTAVNSSTYKGPSAASEPETQTMIAWSNDQRFAKVIDYHSFGREVLWEYTCSNNPLASFWQSEAITLSQNSGYGGANRPPTAEGEHYQWQLANFTSSSFLVETANTFQPSFTSAESEADLVFPGIVGLLERPISVSGNVTDSVTGAPVRATIEISTLNFQNGEKAGSGGAFGRYDLILPTGNTTLSFSATGYVTQSVPINVTNGAITRDVALVKNPACVPGTATFVNGSGVNPPCLFTTSPPVIGGLWLMEVDAAQVAGAASSFVQARALSIPGQTLSFGELFLDLNSRLIFSQAKNGSGLTVYDVTVPTDSEIIGFTLTIQGGVRNSTGNIIGLCNAEDIVVGCP